jgi:hypothetical protein
MKERTMDKQNKNSVISVPSVDKKLLFEEETYAIREAVFEVYREMGCGFLEAVYQECLERELVRRGIPFVAQQELKLIYKGEPLKQLYKPDLIFLTRLFYYRVKGSFIDHRGTESSSVKLFESHGNAAWSVG